MDKINNNNWLNIILNTEFQNVVQVKTLKEVSMVSKLTREKLKPILFKNLILNLDIIKFESNIITIANDNQVKYDGCDYNTLKEQNKGGVENSLNDFIIALNDIKKYTKSFFFDCNRKAGYYLIPLIRVFDNLTDLKIFICYFPFKAFADIGKTLPNLNTLELNCIDLIKSTTEVISESDIIFPPNLSYLKLFSIYIITSTLLSDPYEYLFNTKVYPTSREYLTLPKISIPSLKRLDFIPKDEENRGLEEFLEANPSVEFLYTRSYSLNISSKLNSLKTLDNEDLITFNNIDQTFNLDSINSLALLARDFTYSENVRRLCQLCPNVVNLSINFIGNMRNFQAIIDKYLAPTLSNLHNLKTLVLIDDKIYNEGQILDFTKFAQIEKLKIVLTLGSVLIIKFDNCRCLKRVELIGFGDKFTDEFKRRFNQYDNWKFKFSGQTVKGYKI